MAARTCCAVGTETKAEKVLTLFSGFKSAPVLRASGKATSGATVLRALVRAKNCDMGACGGGVRSVAALDRMQDRKKENWERGAKRRPLRFLALFNTHSENERD